MALAAESAMPSTMMPEKAVDNAGTQAPTGVDDTAESHTGIAIPACMAQLSADSVVCNLDTLPTHYQQENVDCLRYTCPSERLMPKLQKTQDG
jgi:hypothetical protein